MADKWYDKALDEMLKDFAEGEGDDLTAVNVEKLKAFVVKIYDDGVEFGRELARVEAEAAGRRAKIIKGEA